MSEQRKNPLAAADEEISAKRASERAQEEREAEIIAKDLVLAKKGMEEFESIRTHLFNRIQNSAANAEIRKNLVKFGDSELRIDAQVILKAAKVGQWSCLIEGVISVAPVQRGTTWPASLWFVREGDNTHGHWLQLSFMHSPFIRTNSYGPIVASPASDIAQHSFANMMGVGQLAEKPKIVSINELSWFEDLWLERLGKAAQGLLALPNTMPFESVSG